MKLSKIKKTVVSMCVLGSILLTTLGGALASTATQFADVPQNHWAHSYVQEISAMNLMIGVSDTNFAPEATLSRAMAAATLFRARHERIADEADARQTPFVDVPENQWFAPYIAWTSASGIVTDENYFRPNNDSTREFFVTMLYRLAANYLNVNVPTSFHLDHFPDHAQISDWALDAMRWASYNGIVEGMPNGNLAPNGTFTRAQSAAILYRFVTSFTADDLPLRGPNTIICPSLYAPLPNAGHVLYLRGISHSIIGPETLELRYVDYQSMGLDEVTTLFEAFMQNRGHAWQLPHIEYSLELIRSGAANAYLFEFVFVDENGVVYVQPCLRLFDARLLSFYMEDPDEALGSLDTSRHITWTIFPYHIR